jgi:RNA-binding protein
MFELKPAQRRELRARAHHLDPVVSIAGNGLSTTVLKEIELALKAHELIKIRVYNDDREARMGYLLEICSRLDCAPVQNIGKLLVVFKPDTSAKTQAAAAPAKKKSTKTAPARPARPTTLKPPRAGLRGTSERHRKAPLGSDRAKKSAR